MATKKTEIMEIRNASPINDPVPANNMTGMLQIIERCALNPDVDIDKMQKMLDMQKEMMRMQREIEYNTAFAEMQPKLPAIPANGKGYNNTKYAKKEDMNRLVNPILAKFGFALSFQNKQENGKITVHAILKHRAGHSEYTELTLADDHSGNKNGIQAVGSSQSYGERYTMKGILNLTIIGDPTDDDAISVTPKDKRKTENNKFQNKVNADAKKANIQKSAPVEEEKEEVETWDRKTLFLPERNQIVDYENSEAAARDLYGIIKDNFPNKAQRIEIINMNLGLVAALVKEGKGSIVGKFHKLADNGII